MLHLICPPPALKSGSDVVGIRTAEEIRELDVHCNCHYLWSEFLARHLVLGGNRYLRKLYKEMVCPIGIARLLPKIKKGDLVWINNVSRYRNETDIRFEEAILRKGAKYIFHLQDYWFNTLNWNEAACKRIEMADLTVVVTHELKRQVLARYPAANVVFLEEPIDVDRVHPVAPHSGSERPVLVWTGNPLNFVNHFSELVDILAEVHQKVPFVLRVVSGSSRPKINLPFPMEWFPYSLEEESRYLSGAVAGLAPLEDSVYARCKDVYKVKTYMAAGVAPLASGIGHCPSVIRHGVTGWMFNSPQEWRAGLIEVLSNPAVARQAGAVAREYCVRNLSHQALMPVWIDALKKQFPEII